jgi:hypothetical protein
LVGRRGDPERSMCYLTEDESLQYLPEKQLAFPKEYYCAYSENGRKICRNSSFEGTDLGRSPHPMC